MRVAIDSETHLIKPGMLAPKLVCVSMASLDGSSLFKAEEGLNRIEQFLLLKDSIVGQNIAYDLAVFCAERPELTPLVFEAYEAGRISCTAIRQKLIDISNNELRFRSTHGETKRTSHSLAALADYWLGLKLAKKDTWRLRYNELDDIPLAAWPESAKEYAITDAEVTLRVWEAQESVKKTGLPIFHNEVAQCQAAWALHLMALWGIRTDGEAVGALRKYLEAERKRIRNKLEGSGIFRPDGTKDMAVLKALIAEAYKDSPPLTDKGNIQTDVETLVESKNEYLITLAGLSEHEKILTTYVPALERGVIYPLTSSPNALVMTGRTSWGDPNLQNPPVVGGVRECIVPRPGYVFAAADYDTLELRVLSQVCLELFGFSRMAEAISAGKDLHALLGASFLGISYVEMMARLARGDSEAKKARQNAKGFNFGRPGGMGAEKMIEYLKGMGTILHPDYTIALGMARNYIKEFHKTYPEIQMLFNYISNQIDPATDYIRYLIQPISQRVRGRVGFCEGCNTLFQGRAADGAKAALWRVTQACYVDKASPLFGSRPVLFLHDEIICEVPENNADLAAKELSRLMIESMRYYVKDVPIKAKPVLFRRWFKGAEAVVVAGKIVPSRPEISNNQTKWVADER